MFQSKVIRLLQISRTVDNSGTQVESIASDRRIFGRVMSIGMKEAYAAMGVNRNPECKVLVRESADYHGENYAVINGNVYTVLRTYISGTGIELTLERTRDLSGVI